MNNEKLLNQLQIDYLLVNSTNKYLVEYPELHENARYKLTGFSGSTGDALITMEGTYLFVDGRYHVQADLEANDNVQVVKLQIGQNQDDEIRKLINPNKTLGIVSKKVSQARVESFQGYNIKLLDVDPINEYTEPHDVEHQRAFSQVKYSCKPTFITNLEEVSYLTGLRDFSKDNTAKIWSKLFINGNEQILFSSDCECDKFLSSYKGELIVDKTTINAHDYALIKNPVHKASEIKLMKSVKSDIELEAYQSAFERTDKAIMAVRDFIEKNNNLSEFDIAERLREEYIRFGAKSLSFNSIVAINQNSAQAHYAKNSKDIILQDGDLVLIDSGAYYESGLATDITRVFVKGKPSFLQKEVYTTVLKAFLNCFNFNNPVNGFQLDTLAHELLDNSADGFKFNHGLGHGIGINVHEAPPNLSQNEIAKTKFKDGMCFTIEPGLYNPEYFGVRLENSCYIKDGKIYSFVKMGYEGKLIDFALLNEQEQEWLKGFDIL